MGKNKLLDAIEILDTMPGTAETITGIAYHSKLVKKGDLFVCIRGYKTDGHLYLKNAVQEGAVAAVVEELIEGVEITQYLVPDSRLALAALADTFYDHPSSKFLLTGITATNGKTTTTYMTNAILEAHGLKTGMIGTVIIKTGDIIRPAELTTPESLDLHRYFSEMVSEKVTHAVIEVSSSGLELKRVAFSDFNILVVNNISREHIDLHGSFEAYFNAKASLVRNANENQWAVFNSDCPYSSSLAAETKAMTITYGFKNRDADCLVNGLDISSGRACFEVDISKPKLAGLFTGQPDSFKIELSVLGLHSLYNAMAAILIALLQNVPSETIIKALKEFRGVERRFELIFEESFRVIDDHFANSGNIHVTLETLKMMDYKKLHLVYAIRGSRGVTVNRENAEAIAHWVPLLGIDEVIATTSSNHVGEKDIVTQDELNVFETVMHEKGIRTEIFSELPAAIACGLNAIEPGDVLLLAGCQGMDYGASVCLEQISVLLPDLPKERIFAALKNRVAGI